MFVTAIPTWREGDTFLAGAELQRFRILKILPQWSAAALRSTVPFWVVEPRPTSSRTSPRG